MEGDGWKEEPERDEWVETRHPGTGPSGDTRKLLKHADRQRIVGVAQTGGDL